MMGGECLFFIDKFNFFSPLLTALLFLNPVQTGDLKTFQLL